MKREFLQNLKVGDQALPKEIIDSIMAENGRDIEEAKKPFADYDTIKSQLTEAQTTIQGMKADGKTLEDVQQAAKDWEEKYHKLEDDHKKEMADIAFNGVLKEAITKAKGRSDKAIIALLDIAALKESKNQAKDIETALEGLKKDSGYLFEDEQEPPPYAGGTGKGASGKYDAFTASLRAAAGLKND